MAAATTPGGLSRPRRGAGGAPPEQTRRRVHRARTSERRYPCEAAAWYQRWFWGTRRPPRRDPRTIAEALGDQLARLPALIGWWLKRDRVALLFYGLLVVLLFTLDWKLQQAPPTIDKAVKPPLVTIPYADGGLA